MTKKEILQKKVLDRAELNAPKIERVIEKIQKDDIALQDVLCNTDDFKFKNNGGLRVQYGDFNSDLAHFATKQMSTRLQIPTSYAHKLQGSEWGRELAAQIFNEHAQNVEAQRLLLRTVNGTVRGVLSDSYKRLNSLELFKAFLQSAQDHNAKIFDASIDETKSFISLIKPEIIEIETPNNGVVDIVIGSEIRNSDFGDGALSVRTYLINVACMNGMLGTREISEIHRGKRLPERIQLSDKTYQLETATMASIINDKMNNIFNTDNIEREAERIINASETRVDFEERVKVLAKTKNYTKNELTNLVNKLKVNNPDDGVQGDNTLWKFVQGLTSVANQYQTTRKNELIEYASEMY